MLRKIFFALVICLLLFTSCRKDSPVYPNSVIIGISSDVRSFNPLFSYTVEEGMVTALLYLSLVDFRWDEQKAEMVPYPMLAEKWEWNEDSTSVTFYLRKDSYWSDSVLCTAEDVLFSFDVYSDPEVQSILSGSFKSLYLNQDNSIDIKRSFEILAEDKIKINFNPESVPLFAELIFPVIPAHIYKNYNRTEIITADENLTPVTNGPYKLIKWDKNTSFTLGMNNGSYLIGDESPSEIIFKVIPDYNSRIVQLKNGEIDLAELIKPDDVNDLAKLPHLKTESVKGREYDYIGWNNIDPDEYGKSGRFLPNKFFGDAKVRRAMTHAINRKEILEDYLYGYGEIAATPVSPIFKKIINEDVNPYSFSPETARTLLAEAGWRDTNNDGVLEKGNLQFRFTLKIPSGNPRRSYAANIVKNNLKAVGIDVNIETVEMGVLIDEFYSRKLDAWMVGWFVFIPVDLKISWYSDLEQTPYNFAGYRNKTIDSILDQLESRIPDEERTRLLKQFQEEIHRDEPMTFLYWLDNIVVYNQRVSNITINPLGVVNHCWEWRITQ